MATGKGKKAKKRRSNGTGSLVKRQNGMYYFWTVDANGKRRAKSLRTRNRDDALEKIKAMERGITAQDRHDVIHELAKARRLVRELDLPFVKKEECNFSLKKESDNPPSWRCTWRTEENHRELSEIITAKTRKKAKAQAEQITNSPVWDAYLSTNPTCSSGTRGNHWRNLCKFTKWVIDNQIPVKSFTQVTEEIAHDYADHLWSTGISAATFNYNRATLLAIVNAIGRKYGIDRNPWEAVDRKNDEQQTRRSLTTPQIDTLLDNAAEDRELQTLLMLGCYAGMRLKDAALLKWQDVSLPRRAIEYRPFKTRRRNKTALVPITESLYEALSKLDSSTDYLLPRIAAHYQSRGDGLKKALVETIRTVAPDHDHEGTMQRKQTRKSTGFHALRHYFCSTCANKGIPAAQLERMTGDQARTLSKYYVRGEVDKDAVTNALTPGSGGKKDDARTQLHAYADSLPIDAVKKLVASAKRHEKKAVKA